MEEIRFIALFRSGRKLLAIAFVVGIVVAQDATNRFVAGLITQYAATTAERLERALMSPPGKGSDARSPRGPLSTR